MTLDVVWFQLKQFASSGAETVVRTSGDAMDPIEAACWSMYCPIPWKKSHAVSACKTSSTHHLVVSKGIPCVVLCLSIHMQNLTSQGQAMLVCAWKNTWTLTSTANIRYDLWSPQVLKKSNTLLLTSEAGYTQAYTQWYWEPSRRLLLRKRSNYDSNARFKLKRRRLLEFILQLTTLNIRFMWIIFFCWNFVESDANSYL